MRVFLRNFVTKCHQMSPKQKMSKFFFGKKMKKISSQLFSSKNDFVSIMVTKGKKVMFFQNFFWVFDFGHF
jgi:hypothetical protein